MKDLLTTNEVAEIIGISDVRVRQLIYAKKLPAEKIGNTIVVKREDLNLIKDRKSGRPRKGDKAA